MVYPIFIIVLSAYLLGNINGSVCISTLMEGEDVRTHGSGNAGLTNFFRNYGSWNTALVALIDAGKTVVACLMGGLLLGQYGYQREGMMVAAIAVSLGHDFPALLGFRGGKGILSGFAAAIVIDWRIALLILAVFVVTFAITRYVSLGSVLAAVTFAVGFAIFHHDNWFVLIGGVFLGLLAVWMHRSNISRLVKGTESKVHLIHRDLNKK